MRTTRFFWIILLSYLAIAPQLALAAPMIEQIGRTEAILTMQPDPPMIGSVHATLQLSGVGSQDAMAVRFSTVMPSMAMNGPSGSAKALGNGRYVFDLPLQMAAPWTLTIQLSGAINGSAMYPFVVASPSGSGSTTQMPGMSAGDPTAWRIATFALVGVILVGALVLRRDRRPGVIALVTIVALIVFGLALVQARFASPAMDMASMQSAAGSAPAPVTLAIIERNESGGATIAAPASVEPYLTQNIVARAPGLLRDLSAYAGDRLLAGTVVAHLDEPELQSAAQAAAADAEAARIEAMHHAPNRVVIAQNDANAAAADAASKAQQYKYWENEVHRESELYAQGAVSRREYEDEAAQAAVASAAYRASQATLDSAQTRIGDAHASVEMAQAQAARASANAQAQNITAGYTTVVAPDDSVVVKRLVDPGVYVQSGTPILQVAVIDRLRVQAQVAQRDLPDVGVGTPITVTFDDGRTLQGHISSISPVVDPSTHTGLAEAIVPNPGGKYQPGGFAHAILHGRQNARVNSFSVPSTAIVGGASTAVWIDEAGTAHRVSVTVLSDDGTTAQIAGALHRGLRVVAIGASNLEEGQAITEATP
jgi:HlyD family secretion protein